MFVSLYTIIYVPALRPLGNVKFNVPVSLDAFTTGLAKYSSPPFITTHTFCPSPVAQPEYFIDSVQPAIDDDSVILKLEPASPSAIVNL